MSRCFLVALAAFAVSAGFHASAAGAQVPGEDSATGQAVILASFIGVSFDAHSGPSGENPTGGATATRRSTYSVSGTVTCLAVSGNRATIGFAVESGFTTLGHRGHFIFVEDNGSPGDGRDLANERPAGEPPRTCQPPSDDDLVPFPFIPIRPQPIQSGDVFVHDAPPLPTSKDDCKHGGWQRFGFKNQGQCVAFVQRP